MFSKSRRPRAKAEDGGESKNVVGLPPPAGLLLRAVVHVAGKTSVFIVSPSLAEGRWYDLGEKLDGWTVKEEHAGLVTLTDGGRSTTLEFDYDGAQGPQVGSPPPPPPPHPPPGAQTGPRPPNIPRNRRDAPA